MELIAQFVALIEALAWPSVAAWIAYQFRSEIRALLDRVVNDSEEVSAFGVSAKFRDAKRNLSELDVPENEKAKINLEIDNIALSQIKDLAKHFYTAGYKQRLIAAKEIENIGLEVDLVRLIELTKSNSPGERVAAAIAIRKHIERDYSKLDNEELKDAIGLGLKDDRSRVSFRFVELVVGNSILFKEFNSVLVDMAKNDDNKGVRETITRSLGYY